MSQSLPLVSAVVPTYDRPDRLQRAVESVAGQTYGNIELIVVDDCSPTPAERVLAERALGDLRVTSIRHEVNRGANVARNTGIEAASGEFVAFLDDDDEWHPEKIARQVEAFQVSNPETGVVYTGMEFVDGEFTRTKCPTLRGDVTADLLKGRSLAQFSAVVVRSDVIEQAGLPDEDLPSWQDREWYIRLSRHCAFQPVSEPLTVRYLSHAERISDDFETKRDVSYPMVLSKHCSLAAEYGLERRFVASLSAILGWNALENGYYADAREHLLRSILNYPLSTESYPRLLAALGGQYTYRPARWLARAL